LGSHTKGPKCRFENGITVDFSEMGWEGMDWMHLAEDRDKWRAVVNILTNLWILSNAGDF
jgi:hypothetical protein